MNIICFDTSSEILSTGIEVGDVIFSESIDSGFKHSEHLLLSLEKHLKQADITYKDINLVVCTKGPGSFTGLRIGMATAKGLATGLNCPMVSVNTLDVLAYELKDYPGAVVPVLDARKKRFYSSLYSDGKLCSDYMDISPEDLFKKLDGFKEVTFCGAGAKIISENYLTELDKLSCSYSFVFSSEKLIPSLAKLGKLQFEEFGADPDNSGPFYIRLSDAELSIKK